MKNSDIDIVAQNESQVIGVLSGWDRLVFHGCCPMLAYLDGFLMWTLRAGILLKNYSEWVLALSDAVRRACLEEAVRRQRPIEYLRSSGVRKDDLARRILRENPVSEGLVCILTCLEPCTTYRVRGNHRTKRLELRQERTKCLHVYKYWLDREFGLMGARLQTWLPCRVQVWINGREWLARKLQQKGIAKSRKPQSESPGALSRIGSGRSGRNAFSNYTAAASDEEAEPWPPNLKLGTAEYAYPSGPLQAGGIPANQLEPVADSSSGQFAARPDSLYRNGLQAADYFPNQRDSHETYQPPSVSRQFQESRRGGRRRSGRVFLHRRR